MLTLRTIAFSTLLCSLTGLAVAQEGSVHNPIPGPDVALAWNLIMLDMNAADHALASPDQGGPTRTTRTFAIVSVAMFDAWNSIYHKYAPQVIEVRGLERAHEQAAIATAAYRTLRTLYPQLRARIDREYANYIRRVPDGTPRASGVRLGEQVAAAVLASRANDHANDPMTYTPINLPGFHQPDPLHPNQGYHAPGWGNVTPWVIRRTATYVSGPPPRLNSAEYTAAYDEVMLYGGDGVTTPTLRSPEQTVIGIYWGYDGSPRLGTPPRMYNQIGRVIAIEKRNTTEQNVRLFALMNMAMADAGIQCWRTKYYYQFWRPIIAIRAGDTDGNNHTDAIADWTPLGAPATNGAGDGVDFTPPFPAYTSGHATFGAAALWTIAKFYGTHRIPFRFQSDEYNGNNVGSDGHPRPPITRSYATLGEAIHENAMSRIYLGIHWRFDATAGEDAGIRIAEVVAAQALQPVRNPR